jgi:hypothetical protein
MRKLLLLALIIAGLLAAMAGTRWLTKPPEVRTQNAPGQFDAQRAKARLARVIGPSPAHPADTAASDGVRTRLLAELRAEGLNARVQDRFACNGLFKQRGVSCARVRNILVTIGPENGGPHLLVNSHYDSVPVGPGASDAGLGVAAMIEAATLLKGRPLARPVTFLFNEGEELGLVGARAFVDAEPLSRRVDALLNLEARGTTGPVNMFETNLPNPAAVGVFERSVERPVANSLAVSAYRLIPNYTDVNTFAEERRWLTLNFAPIGNESRYHSPGDDLRAVDLATLQHMGDQLLQTGTALAAGTPAEVEGETLFANVGTRFLVTMPFVVGLGLALVALLLLLRLFWVERSWGALLLLATALGAGVALAWTGLTIVGFLREGQFWRAYPKVTELAVYAGVIAAGLAVVGAVRLRMAQWRAAWWLLYLGLGLALTSVASGALIFFVVPPLLYALVATLGRRSEPEGLGASLVAALIVFATLGATLGLLQELLNGGPLWAFALIGGLILMPWVIEIRPLLEQAPRGRLAAGAVACAALAWVPAALTPAYSSDRQQQWSLQYMQDPALRQPLWSVINDRKALPGEWRRFGDWRQKTLPIGTRRRWLAPAPPIAGLPPARALAVETATVAGGRQVRLRLQANGADNVTLLAPVGSDVRGMGVPGQVRRIGTEGSGLYQLSCTGRSCNGQVMELLVGPRPVELMVLGTRFSLPPVAAPLKAAQPRNARAQYVPDSTLTVERVRI